MREGEPSGGPKEAFPSKPPDGPLPTEEVGQARTRDRAPRQPAALAQAHGRG